MSTFNPGSHIYVDRHDDGVTIRFDEDTLGFEPTADGFAVTNDWNDRHFTLGLDENSIFYHLTREDVDDRRAGKRALPLEEFVADIYGYLRSLAQPVPKDRLDLALVGRVDMDEMERYLADHGVLDGSGSGMAVDPTAKADLEQRLNNEPAARGELYQRMLEPVPFDEAQSLDSGEAIYAYPTPETIYILVFYPDEYVGVATVQEVIHFATLAGGSQVIDHVLRSISE